MNGAVPMLLIQVLTVIQFLFLTLPIQTLSDECVSVVAFNVIVRIPASVLAGSKTKTVSPLALVSVTLALLHS
jgi:hypothetical protein